jgi:acetyl-CoA carboxylase carboxyltransferase component
MIRSGIKGQRFVAVFLVGCAAFNFPLLYLFNTRGTLFGVPLLYAYIFIAWAMLIVLLMLVAERSR